MNKAKQTRQARYTERMRAKGFTQIKVWVKPEDRATIQQTAERLRGEK